jgi:hypothetical protein
MLPVEELRRVEDRLLGLKGGYRKLFGTMGWGFWDGLGAWGF